LGAGSHLEIQRRLAADHHFPRLLEKNAQLSIGMCRLP
jgi:hypothetical protein